MKQCVKDLIETVGMEKAWTVFAGMFGGELHPHPTRPGDFVVVFPEKINSKLLYNLRSALGLFGVSERVYTRVNSSIFVMSSREYQFAISANRIVQTLKCLGQLKEDEDEVAKTAIKEILNEIM